MYTLFQAGNEHFRPPHKNHKLEKDEEYKILIENANTVLKIHTKRVDGKVTKLEGEELASMKSLYGAQISSQENTLSN